MSEFPHVNGDEGEITPVPVQSHEGRAILAAVHRVETVLMEQADEIGQLAAEISGVRKDMAEIKDEMGTQRRKFDSVPDLVEELAVPVARKAAAGKMESMRIREENQRLKSEVKVIVTEKTKTRELVKKGILGFALVLGGAVIKHLVKLWWGF